MYGEHQISKESNVNLIIDKYTSYTLFNVVHLLYTWYMYTVQCSTKKLLNVVHVQVNMVKCGAKTLFSVVHV